MGAGKRGKSDKQQRITEAYRLLCLRTPYNGVVKELVRIFNICDRTAKTDIACAAELIKQDFEPDRLLAKNAGLYMTEFNQSVSLITSLGWLVIDPEVDNLPLYQKLYFEALARQEQNYPNGTPKTSEERQDDNSEDCGYRRSHGTKRRPDPELIDVEQ